MKSDHSTVGHRGGFELASSGTVAAVTIVAAALGAALPLGAALGIGFVAAWIGHYLDCHYARGDVSRWRTFGLVATSAAAAGWIARLILDPRHRSVEDSAGLAGIAILVAIVTLAVSALIELRQSRES